MYSEDILDVGPMEAEVAKSLLSKKLKKAGDISSDDMLRLVMYLDCMPLAVTQAAAYIEQATPRRTVSKYIEILETNQSERTTLL